MRSFETAAIGTGQMADTTRFTLTLDQAGSRPGQRGRQVRLGGRPESRHRARVAGLRDRGPLLPGGRRPDRRPGAGGLSGRGGARDRLVHAVDGGHRRCRPGRSDRGLQPRRRGRPSSGRWPVCTRRAGRRPNSEALEWLNRATPESDGFLVALVPSLLPGFLERYADTLAPEHQEVCRLFVEHLPAYLRLRGGPRTASHGDFRLDNLLFQPDDPRPVVVDWQTAGLGRRVRRRGLLHRGLPHRRGPSCPRAASCWRTTTTLSPPWRARLPAGAAARRRAARHLRRDPDGHRGVHGRAADGAGRPHVPHQLDPPRPARARRRTPPHCSSPPR